MVKLTADVISKAENFINPLHDRELNLRGYRIPMLEHLGSSQHHGMDSLNLMDNELTFFSSDMMPWLPRLRHLYLTNNKLHTVDFIGLEKKLPFLESLILTNNQLNDLKLFQGLEKCRSLTYVSCLNNPITKHKWYRSYFIYHVPQLRVLDYQRIKDKERRAAKNYFSNIPPALLHPETHANTTTTTTMTTTSHSTSTVLSSSSNVTNTLVTSSSSSSTVSNREEVELTSMESMPSTTTTTTTTSTSTFSEHEIQTIKLAIQNATTLSEIQRLEELLQRGKLSTSTLLITQSHQESTAFSSPNVTKNNNHTIEELEEMEEEEKEEEEDEEDEEEMEEDEDMDQNED